MSLRAWPLWMKIVWQLVALFVFAMQIPRYEYGPPEKRAAGGFLYFICPDINLHVADFLQEWASSRNWQGGLPIYLNQEAAAKIHLGYEKKPNELFVVQYNAHPPGAVLLGLPLGYLDYHPALLFWNLLSLTALAVSVCIILRELRLSLSPWLILPIAAFLLVFDPFLQQVYQGQLNGLLLFLLTLGWLALRHGKDSLAGMVVGIATAVKLAPGLLLLYFLFQRRWTALGWALATLASITLATFVLFGLGAYWDYLLVVQPAVSSFRYSRLNTSLVGFWQRLLEGHELEKIQPLIYAPWLGKLAVLTSAMGVVAILVWCGRKWQGNPAGQDRLYALYIVAMLLLSPVTWTHTFLWLTLPILVWVKQGIGPRETLVLGLGVLFLIPDPRPHFGADTVLSPVYLLCTYAIPTYLLLALFVRLASRRTLATVAEEPDVAAGTNQNLDPALRPDLVAFPG